MGQLSSFARLLPALVPYLAGPSLASLRQRRLEAPTFHHWHLAAL